jgi:hypothetical protein
MKYIHFFCFIKGMNLEAMSYLSKIKFPITSLPIGVYLILKINSDHLYEID